MFFRVRFFPINRRSAFVVLFAGIVFRCDVSPEPSPTVVPENKAEPIARNLTYPDAWQVTPEGADPLLLHRPEEHSCAIGSWHEELGGLELDTGECNYFSLSQLMAEDIFAGDRLELLLWWQPLINTDPATGHIAIIGGDRILWEEYVPIPSAASVRDIEFFAPQDFPAGTPITLHLHNHGTNTWHFHHLFVHSETKQSL